MLKRNVFMDVLVKRFVRANRIPAVHSPLVPPLSKLGRRESGEALNAFERTENTRVGFWEMPLAKAALFLLFAPLTLSAQAGVREVGAIGLTVGDLDRELMFYVLLSRSGRSRAGNNFLPAGQGQPEMAARRHKRFSWH